MTGFLLAAGAMVSVLAFGGTQTLAFAAVQMGVVLLGVVQFWRNGWPSISRPTGAILGMIVAIPFLQLLPLPAPVLSAISPARVALAESLFSSAAPLGGRLALTVNPYETQVAILKLLCYVLVFLLAFQSYQQGQQNALVRGLILLGILEAAYGSVQYLTGWQYIFTFAKQYDATEGTGTYINRNHYAGLLEMVLPFVLARILIHKPTHEAAQHSRWKRMLISPLSFHVLRDTVVFAVLAVGLVFSFSRMGILAALEGVLLVVCIAYLQIRRRAALFVVFLVLALPLAYSIWIGLNPVIARFEGLRRSGFLAEERIPIWRDTAALIRDHPWLGTGMGTYPWASLHYQTYGLDRRYEHAHNDYLEFAADMGIPASLLLFGGLWILTGKVARKSIFFEHTRDRILGAGCAGALAALLAHGFTDFNLQIPANAFIFAWIAGTAAALVRKPMQTR